MYEQCVKDESERLTGMCTARLTRAPPTAAARPLCRHFVLNAKFFHRLRFNQCEPHFKPFKSIIPIFNDPLPGPCNPEPDCGLEGEAPGLGVTEREREGDWRTNGARDWWQGALPLACELRAQRAFPPCTLRALGA